MEEMTAAEICSSQQSYGVSCFLGMPFLGGKSALSMIILMQLKIMSLSSIEDSNENAIDKNYSGSLQIPLMVKLF